jgi:dihydroneopterin aldolase
MLIFQPSVNFCSDKNIQTIFGIKLEDFLSDRIDYNSISQTVEKVVKKKYFQGAKIIVRRVAAKVAPLSAQPHRYIRGRYSHSI